MTAGRPRKNDRPQIISGQIPGWKKDLIDILGIPKTVIVNDGVDIHIDRAIYKGRISAEIIRTYIAGRQQEAAEIQEKIQAAERLLVSKAVAHGDPEEYQLSVWDTDLDQRIIINRRDFDPVRHKDPEKAVVPR